jgi:hypothetical protein
MKKILYLVIATSINVAFAGFFSPFLYAQQDSSAVADSLLLLEIQQQMQDAETSQPSSQAVISQPQMGSVRATSANTNPRISVIGDFRSLYTSEGDRNFDTFVHGVELNLSSVIDPYARADFYPVFEGEHGDLKAEIEEAYLTSLSLPYNLQLKVGKFRQTFGKINRVHQHALPVINTPIAFENFMGEALNDQGFSLSWLIPNPRFYQELVVELTRGPEEHPIFTTSDRNIPLKLAHLKNFWDLTDNATLELGLSAAFGANKFGHTSKLGGLNVTYKWKPIRYNRYKSFEIQSEFFVSDQDLGAISDDIRSWGMYTWMEYQLSQRWFMTGVYSYSELPTDNTISEESLSATLGWYATEFQKIEVGPRLLSDNGLFNAPVFSGFLRWIFIIGSHGAHQY